MKFHSHVQCTKELPMRIPKFRAYIKATGEMHPVAIVNTFTHLIHTIPLPKKWSTGEMSTQMRLYGFDEIELMQYTGFKDVNEVEIYEGDIVNSHKNLSPFSFYKRTVIRDEDTNNIELEPRSGFILCKNTSQTRFEVIGNVHQHPHLLEEPTDD